MALMFCLRIKFNLNFILNNYTDYILIRKFI